MLRGLTPVPFRTHRVAFGSGFRPEQGALPGVEGPWLAPLITGATLWILTAAAYIQVGCTDKGLADRSALCPDLHL